VLEAIQSPTFTLVAEHDGRLASGEPVRINHLDLYRLTGSDELESLGYEQYVDGGDGITLIEWPERAADWLPERFLLVSFAYRPPGRRVDISAHPASMIPARFAHLERSLRGAGFRG
jgi:tRNA threonylcarbamoyl adenosine modification protein YjeE